MLVLAGCSANPHRTAEKSEKVQKETVAETAGRVDIVNISYEIPAGYSLGDGSINENRIYFNADQQSFHIQVQEGNSIDYIKRTYEGNDAAYNGIAGYEYIKGDNKCFAFLNNGNTYIVETRSEDVYKTVVSSIKE